MSPVRRTGFLFFGFPARDFRAPDGDRATGLMTRRGSFFMEEQGGENMEKCNGASFIAGATKPCLNIGTRNYYVHDGASAYGVEGPLCETCLEIISAQIAETERDYNDKAEG